MVQNHASVFSDQGQLGHKNIKVTEREKAEFLCSTYRPYIQSVVIDHTISRMGSTDLIGAASVFDPCHLPETEDNLSGYGTEKIAKLTDFYGMEQKVKCDGQEGESEPDIDIEETEAEWKLFRRLIFKQYKGSSIHQVLSRLICEGDVAAAFPNLSKLASILSVLPVTTATVERTFSSMKLIKTRLRKRMGDGTLDSTMRICIEGPDHLSSDILEQT